MELQELADDYAKYKTMKADAERQLRVIEPKLLALLDKPVNNTDNSYTVKKVEKEGYWKATLMTKSYLASLVSSELIDKELIADYQLAKKIEEIIVKKLGAFINPSATMINDTFDKNTYAHLLTTGIFPVSDKLELEGL